MSDVGSMLQKTENGQKYPSERAHVEAGKDQILFRIHRMTCKSSQKTGKEQMKPAFVALDAKLINSQVQNF